MGSKLDEVGVKITGAGGKGKYVWPWDNMALGIDCWCDQRGWETRQKRNSQGVPNVLYVILSGILWEIKTMNTSIRLQDSAISWMAWMTYLPTPWV